MGETEKDRLLTADATQTGSQASAIDSDRLTTADATTPKGQVCASASRCEEYYLLLVLAATGAAGLAASVHFASFFLSLELLSVSLYALVAYQRTDPLGIEAGVKYLILAGASAAVLLFGLALVYADLGTLEFVRLTAAAVGHACGPLTLAGLGLILVGIGFKLSLAPFHLWAPDVYQGAPAPITAFVATVSKGAVFALLLRLFASFDVQESDALVIVFTLLAMVSMFVGNWLALMQTNVKRLLAYSSIAHMGYLLVAFLASGPWAAAAVMFYLAAYFITTLGAFGVVSVLSTRDREATALEDYQGLAWRRPWVAGVFALMLLSLAGIPLTAGFVGKFYILAAGIRSTLWLLVVTLVINSAIGLYYYLRVLITLFRPPVESAPQVHHPSASPSLDVGRSALDVERLNLPLFSTAVLLLLALALLALGLYPAPAISFIQAIQ